MQLSLLSCMHLVDCITVQDVVDKIVAVMSMTNLRAWSLLSVSLRQFCENQPHNHMHTSCSNNQLWQYINYMTSLKIAHFINPYGIKKFSDQLMSFVPQLQLACCLLGHTATSIGMTIICSEWRITTSQENGLLVPNKFCISNVDSLTLRRKRSCVGKACNHWLGRLSITNSVTSQTFCVLLVILNPNSRSSSDVSTVKSSPTAETLSLPWTSSHSSGWKCSKAFRDTKSCGVCDDVRVWWCMWASWPWLVPRQLPPGILVVWVDHYSHNKTVEVNNYVPHLHSDQLTAHEVVPVETDYNI